MCASTCSISAEGIRFQETRRLRSAIFNQKWRWYSAVVSLQSSRPSCNRSHTCQRRLPLPDLNEDFIPPLAAGMLGMLLSFLFILLLSTFSPSSRTGLLIKWLKCDLNLLGLFWDASWSRFSTWLMSVTAFFRHPGHTRQTLPGFTVPPVSGFQVRVRRRQGPRDLCHLWFYLMHLSTCGFTLSFTGLTDNCFKSVACKSSSKVAWRSVI